MRVLRGLVIIVAMVLGQASEAQGEPLPPKHFYFDANWSLNALTHYNQSGAQAAQNLSPSDRLTISQYLSFGVYVHKLVRVQLTMRFDETLTGLTLGERSFSNFSFIPWVVFTKAGFFVGAGPLLAIRANCLTKFDMGLQTAVGYAFDIGYGASVALQVQVPVTLYQKVSVSIMPGITMAYRF